MKNAILPQTKSGNQGKQTPSAWVIEAVPSTQPNSLAQELKAVREENEALTKRVSWLEAQMQAARTRAREPPVARRAGLCRGNLRADAPA